MQFLVLKNLAKVILVLLYCSTQSFCQRSSPFFDPYHDSAYSNSYNDFSERDSTTLNNIDNAECSGRKLLNGTLGIISDGPENYTIKANCVWLIQAGGNGKYIHLSFSFMRTECTYDYMFIYDGTSFKHPLLAALSGSSLPQNITAFSGNMLIYFFSDRNYEEKGFLAQYFITYCLYNCSKNGFCDKTLGKCKCNPGWYGESCEFETCSQNCGRMAKQGWCEDNHCRCNKGWYGSDCSVSFVQEYPGWQTIKYASFIGKISRNTQQNNSITEKSFNLLNRKEIDKLNFLNKNGNEINNKTYQASKDKLHILDEITDRTGHGGVYAPYFDQLILFGGFNLNSILDDLIFFSFNSNSWFFLPKNEDQLWPKGRFGHKMKMISKYQFVMFGGESSLKEYTNEMWIFDLPTKKWSLLKYEDLNSKPLKVTDHVIEWVEPHLYIHGGRTHDGSFVSAFWRCDLSQVIHKVSQNQTNSFDNQNFHHHFYTNSNLNEKSNSLHDGVINRRQHSKIRSVSCVKLKGRGGKEMDRRLVGHSIVYHPESHLLIIYAGLSSNTARFQKRSSSIHLYDITNNFWAEIEPTAISSSSVVPKDRAYHRVALVDDYMVVTGGNVHRHHKDESCYDDGIYFLNIHCWAWVDAKLFEVQKSKSNIVPSGRFSHVMAVRDVATTTQAHKNLNNKNANKENEFRNSSESRSVVILVHGGFRGTLVKSFDIYVVPPLLLSVLPKHQVKTEINEMRSSTLDSANTSSYDRWMNHPQTNCSFFSSSYSSCIRQPLCKWCFTVSTNRHACVEEQACKKHRSNMRSECKGLCPLLTNCQACTSFYHREDTDREVDQDSVNNLEDDGSARDQGDHEKDNDNQDRNKISDKQHYFNLKCKWCVMESNCKSVNDKKCEVPIKVILQISDVLSHKKNKKKHNKAYTQSNSTSEEQYSLTSMEQCVSYKGFPGTHWIKYHDPPNIDMPDEVDILSSSTSQFYYGNKSELEYSTNMAVMKGFIHPPDNFLNMKTPAFPISLTATGAASNIALYLSEDESAHKLDKVAELMSTLYVSVEAKRSSGRPLFKSSSKKYYFEMIASCTQLGDAKATVKATVSLNWNLSLTLLRKSQVIPLNFLELYSSNDEVSCDLYNNCMACLTDMSCGWCEGACVKRSIVLDDVDHKCHLPSLLGSSNDFITNLSLCPSCSNYTFCHSCVQDPKCEWFMRDVRCVRKGFSQHPISTLQECPSPCHTRTNAEDCLKDVNECTWCVSDHRCFPFMAYVPMYMYGGCRVWEEEADTYFDCGFFSNCSSCIDTSNCGWCSLPSNSYLGLCVPGDFDGPYEASSCSSILSDHSNKPSIIRNYNASTFQLKNRFLNVSDIELFKDNFRKKASFNQDFTSLKPFTHSLRTFMQALSSKPNERSNSSYNEFATNSFKSSWAYNECPDVDECVLNIHNCHDKAFCTNTRHSFICTCNRGYEGDGYEECSKTCYPKCVHGTCSSYPHYKCSCYMGWSGEDCTVDCNCNFHSSCASGRCDRCYNGTEGEHCEKCLVGFYGNPLQAEGCKPCDCNGHGNESMGICDAESGKCYCKHPTQGDQCQGCLTGYYGSPRSKGKCYKSCDEDRMLMDARVEGALGVPRGFIKKQQLIQNKKQKKHHFQLFCVWVVSTCEGSSNCDKLAPKNNIDLSPYNNVNNKILKLTISNSFHIPCLNGFLMVYDGIPSYFNSSSKNAKKIAVLCNNNKNTIINNNNNNNEKIKNTENKNRNINIEDINNEKDHVIYAKSGHLVVLVEYYVPANNVDRKLAFNASYQPLTMHQYQHEINNIKKDFIKSTSAATTSKFSFSSSLNYQIESFLPPDFINLYGFSMLSCHNGEAYYVFGGRNLNKMFNKVWLYEAGDESQGISNNNLRLINIQGVSPSPRYEHTAVCVDGGMLVYGGVVSMEGRVSDELWLLNFNESKWRFIQHNENIIYKNVKKYHLSTNANNEVFNSKPMLPKSFLIEKIYRKPLSLLEVLRQRGRRRRRFMQHNHHKHLHSHQLPNHPKPVQRLPEKHFMRPSGAGSTLTLTQGNIFYRVGGVHLKNHILNASVMGKTENLEGFTVHYKNNDNNGAFIYKYDLNLNVWTPIYLRDVKLKGIYGHSAVYNPLEHTILIHGGFQLLNDGLYELSNRMYQLKLTENSSMVYSFSLVTDSKDFNIGSNVRNVSKSPVNDKDEKYEASDNDEQENNDDTDDDEEWETFNDPPYSEKSNKEAIKKTKEKNFKNFRKGHALLRTLSLSSPSSFSSSFSPYTFGHTMIVINRHLFLVIANSLNSDSFSPSSFSSTLFYLYDSSCNQWTLINQLEHGVLGVAHMRSINTPITKSHRRRDYKHDTVVSLLGIMNTHVNDVVLLSKINISFKANENNELCNSASISPSSSNKTVNVSNCIEDNSTLCSDIKVEQDCKINLYCDWVLCQKNEKCDGRHKCTTNINDIVSVHKNINIHYCLSTTECGSCLRNDACAWSPFHDKCYPQDLLGLMCSKGECGALFIPPPILSILHSNVKPWKNHLTKNITIGLKNPDNKIAEDIIKLLKNRANMGFEDRKKNFTVDKKNSHYKLLENIELKSVVCSELDCRQYRTCASCLARSHCGWCYFKGLHIGGGQGLCLEGGIHSPIQHHLCSRLPHGDHDDLLKAPIQVPLQQPPPQKPYKESSNHTMEPQMKNFSHFSTYEWHFMGCPPENECLNEHHDCKESKENCVDLQDGFKCVCKKGYLLNNARKECVARCDRGCINGNCIRPNQCKCHFGFVGHDCSTECACNKHSQCPDENHLDQCLQCMNNTMGSTCDQCQPMYVGDPSNGGKCVSCFDFCHQHSPVCHTSDAYFSLSAEERTACEDCSNNTQGKRCETCISGFFRPPHQPASTPCIKCQCNGHSDYCNPDRGDGCDCRNNTKSPRCDSNDLSNPCSNQQCSQCMDNFYGRPTMHHQCYRLLTLENMFCMDPYTQMNCSPTQSPHPLLQNRSVFFAIHLRLNNFNTKVTLDVTTGGLDLYLAPSDDAFQVHADPVTGDHRIVLDPAYTLYNANTIFLSEAYDSHEDPSILDSNKRIFPETLYDLVSEVKGIYKGLSRDEDVTRDHNDYEDANRWLPSLRFYHGLRGKRLGEMRKMSSGYKEKRSLTTVEPQEVYDENATFSAEISHSFKLYNNFTYRYRNVSANGRVNFVRLGERQSFLFVKNVRHRLVLLIPEGMQPSKFSKLYMVLHGTAPETYGSIIMRQDQMNIDLLVFFSAFFSCFFLSLALCILLWKAKQSIDARRSRQRNMLEMEHMASRPSARVVVVLGDDSMPFLLTLPPAPSSAPVKLRSSLNSKKSVVTTVANKSQKSHLSLRSSQLSNSQNRNNSLSSSRYFPLSPLAIEYLCSNDSCVSTLLMELPGGSSTRVRTCFASCLSVAPPIQPSTHHFNPAKT